MKKIQYLLSALILFAYVLLLVDCNPTEANKNTGVENKEQEYFNRYVVLLDSVELLCNHYSTAKVQKKDTLAIFESIRPDLEKLHAKIRAHSNNHRKYVNTEIHDSIVTLLNPRHTEVMSVQGILVANHYIKIMEENMDKINNGIEKALSESEQIKDKNKYEEEFIAKFNPAFEKVMRAYSNIEMYASGKGSYVYKSKIEKKMEKMYELITSLKAKGIDVARLIH